ncbi:MAG: hypothetical protein ACI32C_01375 [Candidatus Enteromonas sp.]
MEITKTGEGQYSFSGVDLYNTWDDATVTGTIIVNEDGTLTVSGYCGMESFSAVLTFVE